MQARNIPPHLDATDVARVDTCLAGAVREHDIHLLWAVESGSRAWGFPSPDSDYDCRFIYRRPIDHYLALWPPRDVVETPLDAVLDVNGWDLGKALRLLLKGNAVVIEWLMSPIVYQGDTGFRDAALDLARRHADRASIGRHYLHLGERQRRTSFSDGRAMPLKKVFYALRPAAVLRWLRLHPAEAVAPMHFPTLMRHCEPAPDVLALTSDLLAQKAETREMGCGELPALLAEFIDREFSLARQVFERSPVGPSDAARCEAEAFLRAVLRERRIDSAAAPEPGAPEPPGKPIVPEEPR